MLKPIALLMVLIIVGCVSEPDATDEVPSVDTGTHETAENPVQQAENPIDTELTLESCQKAESQGRDATACYVSVASSTGDYTICENIHGNQRVPCYTEVAMSMQDESICNQITDPDAEDYQIEVEIGTCKVIVDSVKQKDMEADAPQGSLAECENLANQETMTAGQCYAKAALMEKDYTICQKISGETNKEARVQCFRNVAIASQDPSICDQMTVPDYEYLDIAKEQCRMLASQG